MSEQPRKTTPGEAWWHIKNTRNRTKRPSSYASIQQWARDECEAEATAILANADAIRTEMSKS